MKAWGVRSLAIAAALAVSSSQLWAELSEDHHLTGSAETELDVDRGAFEVFQRFFTLGQPPASVMLHAVSAGMTISDATYLAVSSDIDRAGEFFDTAVSLLPSLPGWACQDPVSGDRYQRLMATQELGPQPTIAAAAQKYFADGRRLAPFPDWPAGASHFRAPVAELASLLDSAEYWYQPGADDRSSRTAPGRVIPVALYRDDRRVVVDRASAARIRQAQQRGTATLPVVIVYNRANQRRISQFGDDSALAAIAERFFDSGVELTPVPEWRVGDYHKLATLDELEQLIEVPRRDQIDADRWNEIRRNIEANESRLDRPLLVTLFRSGRGQVWVDSPATLAVAREMKLSSVPVVLFFHELDRQACGAPARCEDLICDAAVTAGADSRICRSPAERRRGTAVPGAGGGAPPPPPAAPPPPPSSPS